MVNVAILFLLPYVFDCFICFCDTFLTKGIYPHPIIMSGIINAQFGYSISIQMWLNKEI